MLPFVVLTATLSCSHAIDFDAEMEALSGKLANRRRAFTAPNIFSQQDKDDILALHNKVRAETARGEYECADGDCPKATNMIKLQWSDTLAAVATEWAEGCVVAHRGGDDSCKNALAAQSNIDFDYPSPSWDTGCGENLSGSTYNWVSWSKRADGQESSVKRSVELAMSQMESKAYTWDTKACSRSYCSHWTQIVWADTQYVGCGWNYCGGTPKYMFACNYYPSGNVNGAHPYDTGSTASSCPSGYAATDEDRYQDQDGQIYDLSGLCEVSDDPDDNWLGTGTCCDCTTATNAAECAASTSCTSTICAADAWCCDNHWDGTCANAAQAQCDAGGDDSNNNNNNDDSADSTPCVVLDGFESSRYAGNINLDAGQWIQDSSTPTDDNGYIVYKHSASDFYLYTLPGWKEYTISKTVNAADWPKGWCTGEQDHVTDCSGKWYQAENVKIYECGNQPFIETPCFDDAAELVRFLLDGNEASEYMQFDLHRDFGCWNDEPVWRLEENGNATHFIHFNANVGAWQITADYVEGDVLYWCNEEGLADCTAGTWRELNTTTTEGGVWEDENVLATATVELGALSEESEGLSEVDDVAIALVVLLVLGVAGAVALLWCRARRNKGKIEVGFEDADEIEVEMDRDAQGNTTR